jgi:hypothetical protein
MSNTIDGLLTHKQRSNYLMLEASAWKLLKKDIESKRESLKANPSPDNIEIERYFDFQLAEVEVKRLEIFQNIENL